MNLNIVSQLSIPPNVQEAKKKLNEGFFQNAKINGLVSSIYYPGQRNMSVGHAELEVEGTCYTIMRRVANWSDTQPLSKKLVNARDGGLPFKQCHISVTPQQLANLKQDLTVRDSKSSCMHGVSRVLGQSADFHIPYLVNLSPLASYAYFQAAKLLETSALPK